MTIKAIVAIGNQGQVGLNGKLPWHDPEDLKWFREQTMGKVCVVGWKTAQTLPELPGRVVLVDRLDAGYGVNLEDLIIIGGPKTYARWNHLVGEWLVSRIDYSSEADTWFDFSLLDGKRVTYRGGSYDATGTAIREQAPTSATCGNNAPA